MSSVQKKSKKKISPDSKNPPKKGKKEEKNQKTINIPDLNINNAIKNEQIEKEMLKGEDHTKHMEQNQEEEKKITENAIDNNNELAEVSNMENKEDNNDKNIIRIKPRESYLKEKMMKLNYSASLLTTISKSLDTEIKKIKNEMIDNQILITAVPNNIQKIKLVHNTNPPVNKYEKSKLKILKELKDEEDKIKKNMKKIIENEKIIKDESLDKVYSLKQSQSNLPLDQVLKIEKLKILQNQKEKLLLQLNDIEYKINEFLGNTTNNELTRKNKLKNFLDNFERDKEIVETRAKKYFKESKNKTKKIKNMEQYVDKVKKELEEKEKEDQKRKLDLLQEFKKKERAIEQKRYKEYVKKALLFKNFISHKPSMKIKDYLYNKKMEKFCQENDKALLLEKTKRKELMKPITKEDFKEFSQNYDEKKEKLNIKKEEKILKLNEEWKKRRNLLPTFVSSFSEAALLETKKSEEEEILKGERKINLIKLKKNFCKQLKEEKQPHINQQLKQKRLEVINRLENPKMYLNMHKKTFSSGKNKRIILKKRDPEKPSKFKWKLKLEIDPFDKLNNSDSKNDLLIKKPKKIKSNSSFENKEHKQQEKKTDYLREIVTKREQKKSMSNRNIFLTPKNSKQKWEQVLNNFKGNTFDNVNNIKKKVEEIDRETMNKEKKLKLNGGIENNPELGKEVSNLIIDSISAKLSILNKFSEIN